MRKRRKKKKEEEDPIGDVNVVATCCTGFVQIIHFFYFSFQFLYRSNFFFPAEMSSIVQYAGFVWYRLESWAVHFEGVLVPVHWPVRKIPAVPAGTVRYQLPCYLYICLIFFFLELSNQELILPIHMFDFFFFELSNLKLILTIHVDIIV